MAVTKRQKLRALIAGPDPFVLPYGACALHARMAEALGFQAIGLSGGWATVYLMGRPDASLISLSEVAMLARYMAMAVDIPVISDIDQGFGNAINTYFTVKTLINAGVAGVHVEDQPYPRRCGFVEGKEIIPIEEMIGKLHAARDAKMEMDPDFVIIARVDARSAVGGGLEEAIRRGRAYSEEGGADVIYVEGPRSVAEMRKIRAGVPGPLFCSLNAIVPHPSEQELKELGQCLVQLAEMICEPAIVNAWNTLEAYRREGMPAWNRYMAAVKGHPLANLGQFDLTGFPKIRDMEDKYLPKSQISKKYSEERTLYKLGREEERGP